MRTARKTSIAALLAWCVASIALATGANDGEVRKIDKSASKVTIRHGPLASLDMPPMTMVFQVRDKTLLDRVKPGDKVKFDAVKEGGAYVVTHIVPVE